MQQQKGQNNMRKRFLLLLCGTVIALSGCKKNETVQLESIDTHSESDGIEEYSNTGHVNFSTVNDTIYHLNMDNVPQEDSERIKIESLEYLENFVNIAFNYHGEEDLTDRLLPYFGEQGKYENHDYNFPIMLQKEYQRKNITMSYKDMFISGLYLKIYNPDIKQYVLSFSGYVTTDMASNTIQQGTYCNTISGTLLCDGSNWEIAQFNLEYVRTSPCEVKVIDENTGSFQYMGSEIELWEVKNADINSPATQTDITVDEEQGISYNGDIDAVIKDSE